MANYSNKGPTMVPLDMYIEAGFDPKTGLPIKAGSVLPSALKDNIKRQLDIVDLQDALNRYTWHNLPKGLTGNLIERVLYYKGQGMFFYMEANDTFYFLPFALDGSIDVYGRYTGVTPLPFNGSTKDKDEKVTPWIQGLNRIPRYEIMTSEDATVENVLNSCVILRDYSQQISQNILPRSILNSSITDVMAECIPLMRTAMINSTGVNGMKVSNEDEQSNVKAASLAIQKAALNGEKWIPIVGQVEFQEMVSGPTAKAEEFLLSMQALDNYRLSLYGLDNGGLFQKNAHLLQAEQRMNTANSGILMQDGLYQRQEFATLVNSWFGLAIYPEVSEVVNNTDMNGDMLIGADPYSAPMAPDTMENNTSPESEVSNE